ncbi:MAG: ATP-dependent helicase [Candidatus Omnitrophota bacterium]
MKKYTLKIDYQATPCKIDYQNQLNKEQYEVVTQGDGPCLVLAGAGSGKTRTLTYRLAYLLENGVPAQNVLLMTFTNKAAHLMRDRVELLLKFKPKGLWCGTFHHIGNRSIRLYSKHLGLSPELGILDEEDSKNLIKVCLKSMKLDRAKSKFPSPSVIRSIISYSRNAKQDISDTIISRYQYLAEFTGEIKAVYGLYDQKKKRTNNLDYDDLLTEWIRLLQTVPSARERFARQFKYILVDEYQDTNCLQFDVLNALWSHHKNILVVGDDAQSIYSFRAAQIKNILDFPSAFKGTRIFKLELNYRSVAGILTLANEIIGKNENQFAKTLIGARKELPDGKPVLVAVRNMRSQAAFIAQRALELRDEGMDLRNMAVLYRAHYQSAELEFELMKRGIPYITRGGVRFFEQAHIKDALSFLKILQNPRDELSWIRALCLNQGIGAEYADKIFQRFLGSKSSLDVVLTKSFSEFLPKRAKNGFEGFRRIMKAVLKDSLEAKPDQAIEKILDKGYKNYILLKFDNGQDRLDDLKELVNFAHTYKSTREFLTDVTLREGFKGETVLQSPKEEDDEYLVLSTIHQAKGLEWKAVFIIGLCDGQFPHPKSIDNPAQFEEERRLFYVAVTRAKDQLYLTHPMTRFDYNYGTVITRPSVFLQELGPRTHEKWEIAEEFDPSETCQDSYPEEEIVI